VAAVLGIVTLLAYSNSFHSGFVVDNKYLILRDTRIREATAENIGLIFSRTYWWPTSETGLYRPVSTLSYLLNYAVFGNADRPEGYHWLNFLLQLLNVTLVYALALRLVKKFWPAVFIAAVWAAHPVLTESVTNIIGRSDMLAAAAILSGLLMYLKSTDTDLKNADAANWKRYAWLAGLMSVTAIGVLSKESGVAILGVIVLYEFTFWKERKQLRGLALGCAAVAIPLAAMLCQRARVLAAAPPAQFSFVDNPLQGAHFFASRLTAITVMAKYLRILIWPAMLSADYSYAQIPIATGTVHDWLAWIAMAAAIAAVLFQYAKNRLYFFFGMFAFVAIVPVANLLFQTGSIMAERFLYLPSVGFAACVVMIIFAIGERAQFKLLAPILLGVIVLVLGIRTWVRNSDWKDSLSLAAASVRTSPDSFKTHFALAVALSEADSAHANIGQEIEETDKSLAILDPLPDSLNISSVYATAGGNYTTKGDLLVQRGPDGKREVPSESTQAYEKSLRILTRGVAIDRVAVENYAARKIARGKPSSEITPAGFPLLYANLATTYLRLGNFREAYEAATHARLLNPNVVEPYLLISQALAPQGRKEEAAQALVEGVLVSGEQGLLNPLAVLYKYGVDPKGCAITHTAGGLLLDNQCAKVHQELCEGSAELIGLYRQNARPDLEGLARSKAVEQFSCSTGELVKR
jgi:tetratricopeptide (TPR) repeat protein